MCRQLIAGNKGVLSLKNVFTSSDNYYVAVLHTLLYYFLLQDLELLMHVYNRACHELLKIVTEETLNKCAIGAPEFLQYVSPVKMNECSSTKLYEVMPPYFGSPEYKNSLVEV